MTQLILPRRKFLSGALAFIAAPAIIRVAQLMPIKVQEEFTPPVLFDIRMRLVNKSFPPLIALSGPFEVRAEDLKPGHVNWVRWNEGGFYTQMAPIK